MLVRLQLAYDGTQFHGWQRQFHQATHPTPPPLAESPTKPANPPSPGPRTLPPHHLATPPDRRHQTELRTVQAVAARALSDLYHAPITLQGASRTDAGVHAASQTATANIPENAHGPPVERLADALNSRLPPDTLALHAETAPPGFDPIAHCLEKAYRYRFATGRTPPLWDRNIVYHTHHHLDPEPMRIAAAKLLGTHDFAAFAQINHGRESTVRTITNAAVQTHHSHPHLVPPNRTDILVAGNGFLYNMVRIIAGTLHDIGRAKAAPSSIAEALQTADRRAAGPTMGPSGLTLLWQRYPHPVNTVGDTNAISPNPTPTTQQPNPRQPNE